MLYDTALFKKFNNILIFLIYIFTESILLPQLKKANQNSLANWCPSI